MNIINLKGKQFGNWKVIGRAAEPNKHSNWICKCVCGKIKPVRSSKLRNGYSLSCGCTRTYNHKTHGHTSNKQRSPTYNSWDSMRSRCLYPSNASYKWYGEKGITICDRWKVFQNFLDDMGVRPEGKTLDRINSNDNYHPKNCRWATIKQQLSNRSCSKH